MKKTLICLGIILALAALPGQGPPIEKVLEDFVRDFKRDPAAGDRPVTFGIRIAEEGEWQVAIDGSGRVELKSGLPASPAFYYVTDRQTLDLIHQNRISALTAMGRARMSDPAPMDLGFMEGFVPGPEFMGWIAEFTFHFWTRGIPEIVDFGPDTRSRTVHGAQAKVLYYREGLRSSWYQVRQGQHINAHPEDQTNPFPTLVIMTAGELSARIGGRALTLRKDSCLVIPAGVSHEFWNDNARPAEFIIVMFGEGA